MRRALLLTAGLLFAGVAVAATEKMPEQGSPPQPLQAAQNPAQKPVEANLGQMLYENHCRSCHESNAHMRDNRKARSREDIHYWVERWSGELKLKWSPIQVNAVVDYLREKYYKF